MPAAVTRQFRASDVKNMREAEQASYRSVDTPPLPQSTVRFGNSHVSLV